MDRSLRARAAPVQGTPGEAVCLLAESQSRALSIDLAELAARGLGCRPFRLTVPTPAQTAPVPVRSTGASRALQGHPSVLAALAASPLILDLTVDALPRTALGKVELAALREFAARG